MSSARAGHPGTTSGPEPGDRPASEESPTATQAASAPAGTWSGLAVRYAPLITAAAAMTVAGLWGLARNSAMGNDEVVSRWAALLSLRQLAHLLRHVDAVHGLYYLLLHGWMAAGNSPTVMRIPSVIAMTGGAVLVAVIGRRLTGSGWAGLFAGLIMALTPSITYYAQTARSYALVFACVMGLTLILLRALAAEQSGRPATRWWVAYGALLTVGSYLNEMALLVLAAHAITVLLARYGRRAVQHWAIASVAGAVPLAPLLLLSIHQHRALGVIPRPGLHDLWVLYHDYFGATIAAPILLVACAVIAVLPPGRWWRRQRRASRPDGVTTATGQPPGTTEDSGQPLGRTAEAGQPPSGLAVPWWRGGVSLPSVAVPLLLVPAALLILESLAGPPLYIDRYVLYGEAGVALLAGGGLYRIGQWLAASLGSGRAAARRTLVWVPAAVVLVCMLFLQLTPLQRVRSPESRLFNFGGPAQYVAAHARTGDGVLFFDAFFRKIRLGYPADFTKTSDFALAVPPVVANPFRGIDKPFSAVQPLMLARQRIWVIGRRPAGVLPGGPVQAENAVLLRDFTRVTVRSWKGVWVTLWVRR